jgi:hypothetical protein
VKNNILVFAVIQTRTIAYGVCAVISEHEVLLDGSDVIET